MGSGLKKYVKYLKENHLRELALFQHNRLKQANLPMMRFFSHLSDEQLLAVGEQGLINLLDSFEKGTALKNVATSLKNWEEDKIEGGVLKKQDIEPTDLVRAYALQESALLRFIPQFTADSDEAVNIALELSEHYAKAQELAFDVLFRIRMESEQTLRESEERFRSVAQSSADAIIITDNDEKIIFWNAGAKIIFGYSEDEILGRHFNILLDKKGVKAHEKRVNELRSSIENEVMSRKVIELNGINKTGKKVPIEKSASTWISGNKRYFSFIIHDISDRKHAEAEIDRKTRELTASNAELEQFAYVASHDLKEPLRMVSNFTQLLQKRYAAQLDETANDYINYAVDGVKRMGLLINDLLNYSRLNTRQGVRKKVDLNEILRQTVDNLSELIKDTDAEVNFEKLPSVKGDPIQMVQLFQNLISNAIKFNKNKPRIDISVQKKTGLWQFRVTDNGIGIPKQYADRIFVMFQRLHRDEYPGTGIGLAISKKIVERHGGTIWFESGKTGTTFIFTLRSK